MVSTANTARWMLRKRVQLGTSDILKQAEAALTEMIDLEARLDWTNCVAKANIVVDGKELVLSAPVSFLLFLEKQLTDMRTFMRPRTILRRRRWLQRM